MAAKSSRAKSRRKPGAATPDTGPAPDCPLCPRLRAFRVANRKAHPDWHNDPVPSFADSGETTRLLIVGLAPGLQGANRTGRPFTGDHAGLILYPALQAFGFARGHYEARADDGFELVGCRITNAVRCVPPANKPTPKEINTCRQFLIEEIAALPDLSVILALGGIAHGSVLTALGSRKSAFPFRHGAFHEIRPGLGLADSYHCSRYNMNTGRLTTAMFEDVIARVRSRLGKPTKKR